MSATGLSLLVSTQTWIRDSHGLYDYESEHISFSHYETRVQGVLLRQNNSIHFEPAPSPEALMSVEPLNDHFVLRLLNEDQGELWTVVKFLREGGGGMALQCGNIIKLGRAMYQVKEMSDGSEKLMEEVASDTASSEETELEDFPGSEEMVCRICYERQRTRENPLLSPCRCDGTVKYLHLNCLKLWIKSKITTRQTENSVSYQWKTIECDICKLELPLMFRTKTAQVSLFEHDRPRGPFIVLEAYPSDRTSLKSLHVIKMTQTKASIRLGRGHDSDVRINDISVSRCHAMIKFERGQFLIEDNESKFGTLVKIDVVKLANSETATVQVGRSVLILKVQEGSGKLGPAQFRKVSAEELSS